MDRLSRVWSSLGLGGKEPGRAVQDHSRSHYSPELIGGLKDDHAVLLRQYAALERMAIEGRYTELPAAIAEFKEKFDVHVLHENLHFYCYIQDRAKSLQDRELIKSFRGEMNSIGRAVVAFVKRYMASGVTSLNGQAFLTELRQVGLLLMRRIEREEKDLYTLYQP